MSVNTPARVFRATVEVVGILGIENMSSTHLYRYFFVVLAQKSGDFKQFKVVLLACGVSEHPLGGG